MKIRKIIYFAACCLILNQQSKGQSLNDDFNGTSVNTSLWSVILPFGQSQISESGGSLTTTGRGTLATASGFSSPFIISGAVTLNNSFEHFGVTLRSDLSTSTASGLSQFYVLTGILVSFSADGDQISIQQIAQTDPNPPFLAEANFNFSIGQLYDYSITDTGDNVSLAIDGVNLISADTTFGTGNQIGFQSREFNDTSSSMDFVSIQPVPEPSSFGLAAIGVLIMTRMYRKTKIQIAKRD